MVAGSLAENLYRDVVPISNGTPQEASVPPAGKERKSHTGTLERGLAVLEHVGLRQEISTNAIATQLGLSRSAIYRIVHTLKELKYLEADDVTGRVRLGARLVELGARAMSSADPHKAPPQAES
ncbi:helix-turn-helix domain-containing protein [Kibdelosporangium persicum]|uniref:HTH iclR-type domain-containing protein n=1 Tax=Kibdelosporangium persicum TaxID=2698649 RepID=A0ABX2F601_9PSEU|nr:helix-turn-helix domain-containing protein [Kibdelosporangium persicum]NRN66791.1 hypothetical protein [Kibdelosporangium persicum]